jgi:hypothetical protein
MWESCPSSFIMQGSQQGWTHKLDMSHTLFLPWSLVFHGNRGQRHKQQTRLTMPMHHCSGPDIDSNSSLATVSEIFSNQFGPIFSLVVSELSGLYSFYYLQVSLIS